MPASGESFLRRRIYVARVTIGEIAARAGVSTATVSRVVNQVGQVSSETEARVRTVMREMAYQPNLAAKALVTGGSLPQSRCVRIFSRGSREGIDFFSEVEKGILHTLSEFDCTAKISYSGPWGREYSGQEAIEDCLGYAGVILLGNAWQEVVTRCREAGVPVVAAFDRAAEREIDEFEQDNIGGAALVAAHLIGLGHRRIGYVGLTEGKPAWEERYDGLRNALRRSESELTPAAVIPCEPDDLAVRQAFLDYYSKHTPLPFTAVFCANDLTAFCVLKTCRMLGIDVPRELSIAGFDNHEFCAHSDPTLTTAGSDKSALGSEMARRIVERMQNNTLMPIRFLAPVRLFERDSTARIS